MATTRKFNTTVKIGSKTYAVGEDVPVSKNGLSEADANNLDSVFGKYRAPATNAVDKRIAVLTEERDALVDEVETLRSAVEAQTGDQAGKLTAITAERDELAGKLKAMTEDRDQLAEDNATLAGELKKLQGAADKGKDAGKPEGGDKTSGGADKA